MVLRNQIDVTDNNIWLIFKFDQYKNSNIAKMCALRENSLFQLDTRNQVLL